MKEVKEWLARRSSMSVNKSTILSTSVLLLGLLMFFIPWRTEVVVSGVLHAEKQASIFVPDDAQLVERQVTRQARVAKGQPLFRFYSPELTQAAQSLRQHIRSLEKQQDVNPFDQEAATGLQVVREALFSAREQLTVIERQIEALTVVAPFDGVMAEMSDQFNDGSWLASGEWLGTLISPHQQTVEAFLEERDLSRVSVGNSARFIPENMQVKRLPLRVTRIEQAAISSLSSAPELASIHGGDIATKAPRGEHSGRFPLVENALYRVFLTPLKNGNVRTQPFVMRGKVVIEGKAQSIASRLFKRVLAVLVRESSF